MTDDLEMTLKSLIDEIDDGESDQKSVAMLVIEQLLAEYQEQAAELLLQPVANYICTLRRLRVRKDERSLAEASDPLLARKELLEDSFYVSGVGMVKWGKATADHHAARSEYLRRHADGLLATAELHDDAIRQIQEAGVTCLNDIGRKRKVAKAA